MNPALLAALITQLGIPELIAWLKSRNGAPVTDADIIAKLGVDEAAGIAAGQAFLDANP